MIISTPKQKRSDVNETIVTNDHRVAQKQILNPRAYVKLSSHLSQKSLSKPAQNSVFTKVEVSSSNNSGMPAQVSVDTFDFRSFKGDSFLPDIVASKDGSYYQSGNSVKWGTCAADAGALGLSIFGVVKGGVKSVVMALVKGVDVADRATDAWNSCSDAVKNSFESKEEQQNNAQNKDETTSSSTTSEEKKTEAKEEEKKEEKAKTEENAPKVEKKEQTGCAPGDWEGNFDGRRGPKALQAHDAIKPEFSARFESSINLQNEFLSNDMLALSLAEQAW